MMRRNGFVAAGVVLSLSAGVLSPVAIGASPPPDVGVQIYVRVLDGDAPVSGLAARDFEVLQRGKPVPILEAVEVDVQQWVLFFDFTFGPPAIAAALEASEELLTQGWFESDSVGVVIHTGDDRLQMLRPTTDHDSVVDALAAMDGDLPSEGPLHPNADYLVSVSPPSNESGRGLAYAAQARIDNLARALEEVASQLAFGEGRHILLFSRAFDLSVAFGNDRTATVEREHATRSAEARATGHPALGNNLPRAAGGVVEASVLQSLGEIRRGGTSIHSVRLTQEAIEPRPRFGMQGPEGLAVISEATGGQVIRESDDLVQTLAPLVTDTRGGYRLMLQGRRGGDRRFRPIEVRLLGGPPGAELMAPAGYYE